MCSLVIQPTSFAFALLYQLSFGNIFDSLGILLLYLFYSSFMAYFVHLGAWHYVSPPTFIMWKTEALLVNDTIQAVLMV